MLRIEPQFFDRFPNALIGVVVARGIDNSSGVGGLSGELSGACDALRASLQGAVVSEHPKIACWREAYRAFGAKPKKYPSSIEAIVRRVLKGNDLPAINPLVDVYNLVSLRHLIPVGGEDLDKIVGDLVLRFARDGEPEAHMLGRPAPEAPSPGELIYADDAGAVCRRWNWRESARTCLSPTTENAILVVEALPPTTGAELDAAIVELQRGVETYCGARCESEIFTLSA